MPTRLPAALALALALLTPPTATRAADPAGNETVLFNGHDLAGWRKSTGQWLAAAAVAPDPAQPKKLAVQPGQGVLVNGTNGVTSNLRTEAEFADVEAHVEFLVPKDSNSGVYFMGRYEIQILDSFGKKSVKSTDCGGIYGSCSEPKPNFPGRPASTNASLAPGQWQSFDVVFRAPRFDAAGRKTENARFIRVTHNGQLIHENIEVPRPTCAAMALDEKPSGPIMLQGDHGPVAYRNLRVRRVNLN
ncbi:MAG: hypothetical protein RJA22_941 [Verrucomicrobiota bacterium]|jgi:hypothetical protein